MPKVLANIGHVNANCKTPPQLPQGQATQPTARRTISREQRAKLRAAQLAYVASDPRWAEHRRKLAAAQEARRMTLFENEVGAIIDMRKQGQAFSCIAKRIGICREVIKRELTALGHSTERIKTDRRMKLFENEVTAIVEMRKKGRTFEYIAEEIGVCRNVIKRELLSLGHSVERITPDRRARRGKGFWRSFD